MSLWWSLGCERAKEINAAIDYEKRGRVAYISLNNPGKANTLDKPTSDAISEALIDLWEDRDTRCAMRISVEDSRM
jgi:enoyl-CoA hydratase/carnithine racemase